MKSDISEAIESVFQLVDREVWIVTAASGPRQGGLLATWVSQISLDPAAPGVVVGIASNHFTAELIEAAGTFALHLIAADQLELAWRFATASGREIDKLAGLAFRLGAAAAPVLDECVAWLECRVITRFDTGDRYYYWADVVDGGIRRPGTVPLREKQLIAAASASSVGTVEGRERGGYRDAAPAGEAVAS